MNEVEKLRLSLLSQNDQLIREHKDHIINFMNSDFESFRKVNLAYKTVIKNLGGSLHNEENIIAVLATIGYLIVASETRALTEGIKDVK